MAGAELTEAAAHNALMAAVDLLRLHEESVNAVAGGNPVSGAPCSDPGQALAAEAADAVVVGAEVRSEAERETTRPEALALELSAEVAHLLRRHTGSRRVVEPGLDALINICTRSADVKRVLRAAGAPKMLREIRTALGTKNKGE